MAYKHDLSSNAKLSMVAPRVEQSFDYYASYMAELELYIVKEIYLSLMYRY